jgi:hypothetical protein
MASPHALDALNIKVAVAKLFSRHLFFIVSNPVRIAFLSNVANRRGVFA